MKIKRYKKIRKILHSYQITHNIKAPFKVAVDGEFLQSALAGQIMLKEQMPKMLQEERTTVYVTPCIDNWLRLKGPQYSGALFIASKLAHLKCRHDKGFVRPFDCIRHLIANGNPDHLLIGAQDEPIRKLVRHCAGVPLLFIHGSTCIMEAPTVTTKEAHADDVAKQIAVIQKEEKRLVHEAKKGVKTEAGGAGAAAGGAAAASSSSSSSSAAIASKKKKKPKGPKQPNPLSVKKKKAPTGAASASDKKIKTESGAASASAGAGAGASEKKVKTEGGASNSGGADAPDGADARPTKKIKTESGAPSASASASSVAASPTPAASSAAAPAPTPSSDGAAASSAAGGSKGRKRARSYKKKADGAGSSESASATAPAASMDDAP